MDVLVSFILFIYFFVLWKVHSIFLDNNIYLKFQYDFEKVDQSILMLQVETKYIFLHINCEMYKVKSIPPDLIRRANVECASVIAEVSIFNCSSKIYFISIFNERTHKNVDLLTRLISLKN